MKDNKVIPITIIIGIVILMVFCGFSKENVMIPKMGYKVYLDGNELGVIKSKDDLYALINKEQKEIKKEYEVDNVYPPKGFNINKLISYDAEFATTSNIYNMIKNEQDFTIKGYQITIKETDGTEKYIYVLDKKIFDEAIENIIKAFINYDEYLNYLNDTQPEIVDVGEIIESMYFEETITTQETLIGVNEKIYTDVKDLTQYLLFGDNVDSKKYTVQLGDTIPSIAEDHKLNSQEFLIANADLNLKDETALLAIGQVVSIALINPVLSLTYDVTLVEDAPVYFEKETKYDYSKDVSYKVVTQQGVNGINRNTQKLHIVNGETLKAIITNTVVLREPVTEITTRGKKYSYSYNYGSYVDVGGDWKWPTNSPYIITSPFGYRWGSIHEGIDISAHHAYGSPIYAVRGGVVEESYWQTTGGNVVIINHQNGYYSMYAHMAEKYPRQGDVVQAGQKIGTMGCSGTACTGTHLHFGIYNGRPYRGGVPFDPKRLYQ